MKWIKIHIVFLSLVMLSFTCIRSTFSPIDLSSVTVYEIDGLKVIQMPSQNEVVSAQLFLKGGVSNYSNELEGIEFLSLKTMMEGGPKGISAQEYQKKLWEAGGKLTVRMHPDFSTVGFTCLVEDFRENWDLFSDVITNPAFETGTWEKVKENALLGIRRTAKDEWSQLGVYANQTFYTGQIFSRLPYGTEESLARCDLETAEDLYRRVLMNRQKMVLVICGNADYEIVGERITLNWSSIPSEPWTPIVDPAPPAAKKMSVEAAEHPFDFVRMSFRSPVPGSIESSKLAVALEILRSRMENKMCNNVPDCGGVHAGILSTSQPLAYVEYASSQPREFAAELIRQMEGMAAGDVTPEELNAAKATLQTWWWNSAEGSADRAYSLGKWAVISDWTSFFWIPHHFRQTELSDIQAIAASTFKGFKWSFRGRVAQAAPAYFPESLKVK